MRLSLNSVLIALASTSIAVQLAYAMPFSSVPKVPSYTKPHPTSPSTKFSARDNGDGNNGTVNAQLDAEISALANDAQNIDVASINAIFSLSQIFGAVAILSAGTDASQPVAISDIQNQLMSATFNQLLSAVNSFPPAVAQYQTDLNSLVATLAQVGISVPDDNGDN